VPWLCPGPLLLCLCPAAVAVCGNDGLVADPARACVRPAIDSLRSGGALRVCASGGCVVGVSATERRWCGGGCWRAPGGAGPPCLPPPGRCRRRRRCRLHTPHPTPHTCTSHAPPRTDPPRWYSMAHTRELTNLSGQGHVCVLAGEVHGAQAGWAHGVHGPGSGCAPSLPARVGAMAGPALGQPAAAGWLEGSAHAPAAGRRACCAVLCCPAPPRPCAPADASASASASASAGPADSAQRLLAARPSLCRWPAAGLACQTQPPEEVKRWLADRQCAVCSLAGWLAGWLAVRRLRCSLGGGLCAAGAGPAPPGRESAAPGVAGVARGSAGPPRAAAAAGAGDGGGARLEGAAQLPVRACVREVT
jgi:hypothetical protein